MGIFDKFKKSSEAPEFMLMIPDGEAATSKELSNFLEKVRKAGYKAEYSELGATDNALNDAARRINNEARGGD